MADPDVLDASLDPNPTSVGRWHRAVGDGATGRYAAAFTGARSLRHCSDTAVRSLAWSLEASLLRQLGRHASASVADGRALTTIGLGPHHSPRSVDAVTDALVGLAADSIGPMRLERAAVLLERARAARRPGSGGADGFDRSAIRINWVAAEIAMAGGDGSAAVLFATAAVEQAAATSSARHRLKSDLVLAAAHLVSGHAARARTLSVDVLDECENHGFLPLAWAAAAVADAVGVTDAADRRGRAEVAIRQRGGIFRT